MTSCSAGGRGGRGTERARGTPDWEESAPPCAGPPSQAEEAGDGAEPQSVQALSFVDVLAAQEFDALGLGHAGKMLLSTPAGADTPSAIAP